jgi:transposase
MADSLLNSGLSEPEDPRTRLRKSPGPGLDPPAPASDTPETEPADSGDAEPEQPITSPRLKSPLRGRRLVKSADSAPSPLTGEQRLLLLDTWRRSGLPAGDFAPLVGISKHTLYAWKHKFETDGPAGLEDQPRGGPKGSRLPEVTKRAILMLKQDNPEWGCERISALLLRGPGLPAWRARDLHLEGIWAEFQVLIGLFYHRFRQ